MISGLMLLQFTVRPSAYIRMIRENYKVVLSVMVLQTLMNYSLFYLGMDLVPGESLVRHTLKGKYISGTAYNGASFYVLDTRALKSHSAAADAVKSGMRRFCGGRGGRSLCDGMSQPQPHPEAAGARC